MGQGISGNYKVMWDSTDENGHKVSSGLYFYQLSTPTKIVINYDNNCQYYFHLLNIFLYLFLSDIIIIIGIKIIIKMIVILNNIKEEY